MSDQDEPRSDATLKNLPEEAQEELWLLHRPEEPDADPISASDMLAEIPLRHGFTVGKSTFYEWRSWYGLRRRLARARQRARQAELEAAADGTLDPAAIARVGQAAFTSESVESGNVKVFVALERLRQEKLAAEQREREKAREFELREKALQLDEKKFEEALRQARRAEEAKKDLEKRKAEGGLSDETLELIERTLGML